MNDEFTISLKDVSVDYALRHAHHYNLKRSISDRITRNQAQPEIISALRGITLDIPKGSRIGLCGSNGSGKSTLLAVMAGTLTPTFGTATTHGRVLALLGGPNEGLDPEQTGRENAAALGIRLGESPESMKVRLDEIKDFSGLGPRFDHPVYSYSSGMQVRLRFSTITSIKADVLLVDEGIGAADAEFSDRAGQRLRKFFADSGTLVIASHSPDIQSLFASQLLEVRDGQLR